MPEDKKRAEPKKKAAKPKTEKPTSDQTTAIQAPDPAAPAPSLASANADPAQVSPAPIPAIICRGKTYTEEQLRDIMDKTIEGEALTDHENSIAYQADLMASQYRRQVCRAVVPMTCRSRQTTEYIMQELLRHGDGVLNHIDLTIEQVELVLAYYDVRMR